jgi:CCR4-NOT transcription complex subunit 1
MLVLLHDFPEFLSDHHISLCDAIPNSCVQLRNLVLTAYPRVLRLPDPFTPNLKIESLPEINQHARSLTDYVAILSERGLSPRIDAFLSSRQPADFPSLLLNTLCIRVSATEVTYNSAFFASVVMYISSQSISVVQSTKAAVHQTPAMDIFKHLATNLEPEGKYLLFNSMANQLRYPNSHTHFFFVVFLTLFAENEANEAIQETITRVLLERLIVHRPHPWGLLVTFIELIKNPRFNFWRKSFIHISPEIERVFESMKKSCIAAPAN